jgi:hypothetical protein
VDVCVRTMQCNAMRRGSNGGSTTAAQQVVLLPSSNCDQTVSTLSTYEREYFFEYFIPRRAEQVLTSISSSHSASAFGIGSSIGFQFDCAVNCAVIGLSLPSTYHVLHEHRFVAFASNKQ